MLFNSFEFIFILVPATLVVFALFGTLGKRNMTVVWLVAASLFFYGWWDIRYVALLVGSVAVNFSIGWILVRGNLAKLGRKGVLITGLAFNLGLLGWFKYSVFIVSNLNAATDSNFTITKIILPLGISFFTFQQIAFLVDAYRNKIDELAIGSYSLFVVFFPQLIAGPIVHHAEMRRQYDAPGFGRLSAINLTVGATIFAAGLFKKVILADYTSTYANPVFQAALDGTILTQPEAWVGAIAYSLQIYFDFSGYSDMAIGAAWLFGVRLQINFNSPYKAANIIDFWRRWHITLSRFLRDYLYFPLGGNRRGQAFRYVNLGIVMLLGGLWHGAGWTFVVWGALHGFYLMVNHGWQSLGRRLGWNSGGGSSLGRAISRTITFVAVVVAWVIFRAETFESAKSILSSMAGLNGLFVPNWVQTLMSAANLDLGSFDFVAHYFANNLFNYQDPLGPWLVIVLLIALFAPNTQEMMGKYCPALTVDRNALYSSTAGPRHLNWQPAARWGIIVGAVFGVAVLALGQLNEFLYFQF